MPARERPCLEHVQRCPGLLVAFSLSLVSFKTGGHKPETKLRTSAAPGTHPSARHSARADPRSTGIFAQQAWLYLMVYLHGGSISDNRKYSRTH